MIQGAMTAMVTPFTADGEVDYERLRANVTFQIENGIDGLVPVGTTGESPTLSHSEHREVIETVVAAVEKRIPVVAGTGSNSTAEAVELTEHARKVGATAALVVNPYYNKPTQEGLYRHYSSVADVGLPVVLYNIPGRTSIELGLKTIERLAAHPNIVAIKEATGKLDVSSDIARLTDLDIVSGDDSLTLPIMSVGGKGVISVVSNLVPDRVKALTAAAQAGDYPTALKEHQALFPLFKGAFIETNPIPIKTAMAIAGVDTGVMRLPLCEMALDNRAALMEVLDQVGIKH